MDLVALQATNNILESKLARSQELLESTRELSNARGAELITLKRKIEAAEAKIRLAFSKGLTEDVLREEVRVMFVGLRS